MVSQSCNSCASTTCIKIGQLQGQLVDKPKTPVGPIVGGVIAGVIGIALATFAIWWFCIRPKRKATHLAWDPPEKRDQSTLSRNGRQSTAHSVASTVLSRASNFIPIAYIPGVTVRSPPQSPGIPPPMPNFMSGHTSTASTPLEQHFFMPGDLRNSTWSDTSSVDPRISLAPSLARTTYYGDEEDVPPVPAVQAFRAHANMVSVKSGSTTPSGQASSTPAIQQTSKLGSSNSSIVARNVMARPVQIKKSSSGPRVPTLGNLAKDNSSRNRTSTPSSETNMPVFFDEKEVMVSEPEGSQESLVSPLVKPKPSFATFNSARSSSVSAILPTDGPLASNSTTTHRHSKSEGLNAMIEEAINRARNPHVSVRPEFKKQDSSPFSDQHEIKENTS